MEILLYVTNCPERVIAGGPLALNMPDDDDREQFLEVLAESFEAHVLRMKNGDHMLVKERRR